MLTHAARKISEISNMTMNERDPMGNSAFAHKGGMHIDGVAKATKSFEHVDPDLVGNKRRFLMSEVAGRRTILDKMREICPSITKESREAEAVINRLKELEHNGYQFEGAESSFELIIRKQLGKYQPFFELESFKLITEQPSKPGPSASALIKVKVEGRSEITAAEGDGPVHALTVPAQGPGGILSRTVIGSPDRLQGARDRLRVGHRREGTRTHRIHRRGKRLVHRRGIHRHNRGKLDCAC